MAKFQLDTEAIETAVTSIKTSSKNIGTLQAEVSGYAVPSDDEFDFAGAKAKLAESLESCESVLKNAAKALENVAETHTNLQEKTFAFDNTKDYSKKVSSEGKKGAKNTSEESNTSSEESTGVVAAPVGNTSSSGDYSYYQSSSSSSSSSGSSSSGSSSSHSSSSGSSKKSSSKKKSSTKTTTTPIEEKEEEYTTLEEEYNGLEEEYNETPTNEEENVTETENETITEQTEETVTPTSESTTSSVITNSFTKVDYAYIKEESLKDESKTVLANAKFNSDTGYSMIENKYLITCDSSLGKVGDVIRFTNKDGTTTECIVGINTYSENYKQSVNFLVDKETWSTKTPLNITENLLTNNEKIENLGLYTSTSTNEEVE